MTQDEQIRIEQIARSRMARGEVQVQKPTGEPVSLTLDASGLPALSWPRAELTEVEAILLLVQGLGRCVLDYMSRDQTGEIKPMGDPS